MTKFKIKSSQKENWRYIGFEVISDNAPDEKEIIKSITSAILRFVGEVGASETNVWLIEYDEKRKRGIFRCSNRALTKVLGAITTISNVAEKPAVFNTLGVSGTIKKLKLQMSK